MSIVCDTTWTSFRALSRGWGAEEADEEEEEEEEEDEERGRRRPAETDEESRC
jgi:hypothetical protein